MWIEQVSVENFRLFKKRTFSFHPYFNLLVGENGNGKTSLITLLAICVSAWVENICSPSSISLLNFTEDDIRTILKDINGEFRDEHDASIHIEALSNGIPVLSGNSIPSKLVAGGFACFDINNHGKIKCYPKEKLFTGPTFQTLRQNNIDFIMPVFTFYRCNRLWNTIGVENNFQKAMEARFQRLDGYNGWADAHTDDRDLMLWMQKLDIIAYQEKTEPLGWRVFQTALKICYEDFEQLKFMAKEGQLVIFFLDGRRLPFNHLSDGQRTLFAMIGDLVRRAVLLNPHLGDKVLEETPGIVLIDELDLHLHPKWQRRIIEDLRRTFPKIQFIATTHSPFLIQSLRDGGLIQLDGETGEEYSDASIEDIAENIQGVEMPQKSLRFTQMMEAAEAYYKRLHECADATDPQTQSLKQRLDELSIPFSDDPAFAAFLKFERDTLVAKEDKEA